MNVVIYARCSTGAQVEAESVITQVSRLRSWSEREEHTIIGVHTDEGLSGGNLGRPGIHAAVSQACSTRSTLVVVALSRLGRNTRDVMELSERLHAKGAAFYSLSEQFISNSAMGRLLTAILAATAAWEREALQERTRDRLAVMRREGRRISRCVYGHDLAEDGVSLTVNAGEQAVIEEMRVLRAAGMSFDRISETLNLRGIPAKQGGPWSGRAVRLVLARQMKLVA